ncbi:MAG: hypothetical protein AAFQ42_12725 [Pseudomonadota bacterium]
MPTALLHRIPIAFAVVAVLATASFVSAPSGVAATASKVTSSEAARVVRSIPTQVFEVLVAGAWEAEKKTGYYRAVATAAGKAGEEHAEVFLQWIAVDKKSATVFKSVGIEEVARLKVPGLTLAVDAEEDGRIILIISHFDDETGEPSTLEFTADKPGSYVPVVAEIASGEAAAGNEPELSGGPEASGTDAAATKTSEKETQ